MASKSKFDIISEDDAHIIVKGKNGMIIMIVAFPCRERYFLHY